MRVWYHYLRERNLEEVVRERALHPRRRFIFLSDGPQTLPERARLSATWGFHCPEPSICTKASLKETHRNTASIRKMVAQKQPLYLLEIKSPMGHDLNVADTSMFEEMRKQRLPEGVDPRSEEANRLYKEFKESAKPIYQRYYESLIPFEDYQIGQYKEPEIVCFSEVRLSQIKVIQKDEGFVSRRRGPNSEMILD